MRTFKRVRELTEAEQRAWVPGTKSRSGFTMRRRHILLLSADGLTPQPVAHRLHWGDPTVGNGIRAFEREGLACLPMKSSRPHPDPRTFTAAGLQRRPALVHRSPRDLGGQSRLGSLAPLAQVCFPPGLVARSIRYEAVRRSLGKLGWDGRHAPHPIPSHDPQ